METESIIDQTDWLMSGLVRGRTANGRNLYDKVKKAQLVGLCQQPGVSIAKVALINGINANLLHKWIVLAHTAPRPRVPQALTTVPRPNPLIAVTVPQFAGARELSHHQIELVLPRGLLRVARVDAPMLAQLIEALR